MTRDSVKIVAIGCVLVSSLTFVAASCDDAGDGTGGGGGAGATGGGGGAGATGGGGGAGATGGGSGAGATGGGGGAGATGGGGGAGADVCDNGSVVVTDFGANGIDTVEDTSAIQSAIDSIESGVVCVPDGVYLVDAETHVVLHSNITLKLLSGATLKALPSSAENYAILRASDVTSLEITGGSIVGERDEHTGDTGEWGMGILVEGSTDVRIAGVNVSECWGDGIYIGSTGAQNYCENVVIEDFTVDHNRRNGITIISARNLTLRNGTVSNTQGTPPQSGIDLEPNDPAEFMLNVSIEDVATANNGTAGFDFGGWGLDVWFGAGTNDAYAVPMSNVSIDVINFSDTGSYRGAITTNVAAYIDYGYDISVQ